MDEPLEGGGTVTITTDPGEVITDVSTGDATAPSGFFYPFGIISYTTTSDVGGKVIMTFEFSAGLPDPFTIFKVDNNGENPTELPATLWTKVNATTVEVTVEDNGGLTDMGPADDGFIVDPIAVAAPLGGGDDLFDFGGGGCTLSNTRSTSMDPIWLFLLLAPGLGILRRRVAATGTRRAKNT